MAILSNDLPWTLTGDDTADNAIRWAGAALYGFTQGAAQLGAFANTAQGREMRQRAVAKMLGDFDKGMTAPRAFLADAAKELTRLRDSAIGFLLMKDPRSDDGDLAAERERECRAHLAAQGSDEHIRGLHLLTRARQGDTRYLRAAWRQNPSVPLVSQDVLDAALMDWMQVELPTTWAKIEEITRQRVLVEYATREAERMIGEHVGGMEQAKARELAGAA